MPGQVLVGFRSGTIRAARSAAHDELAARLVARVPSLGLEVVRLRPGISVSAAVARYSADPSVRYAEPNFLRSPQLTPTDPEFDNLWGLENTGQQHLVSGGGGGTTRAGTAGADIDAASAWDVQTGSSSVIVAVIDTGVDVAHPDLDGSLWVNAAESAGTAGVDDDGNGYVDDVNGYDFENGDPDPSPGAGLSNAHGTHVSGTIAAEMNNAEGVVGVCAGCRVMALRFGFDIATEVQAIEYAVANGARIINASYGGPMWTRAEHDAIEAAGLAGVLFVAAASNDNLDNDMALQNGAGDRSPSFPASYALPTVLSVAATNHRDQYAYSTLCAESNPTYQCAFTNWGGESVDVAAPGVDVMSSVTQGLGPAGSDYSVFDGTSMATPHVAGVAGLVLSQNPLYSALDIKNAIMNSVELRALIPLFAFQGGAQSGRFTRSGGRVDALAALTGSVANATPLTDGNVNGATGIRGSVRGRVAWPEDVNDVYRKRLRRGRVYQVALNGPRGTDNDLWIWNVGTQEIWQFTAGCFGLGGPCPVRAVSAGATADEVVRFRAKKSGVYFLHVSSFFSDGRYTLEIRRI